jgi:hypothetical protein
MARKRESFIVLFSSPLGAGYHAREAGASKFRMNSGMREQEGAKEARPAFEVDATR